MAVRNISKKMPPKFNGQTRSLQSIIQRIYDDLNELISSVNVGAIEDRSTAKGKIGDIRVVKNNTTRTNRLEVFTEDGWAYITLTESKD